MDSSRPEIVIFDVEAVRETIGGTKAILEFGVIIVCPQMLVEKEYFSSLVRPQHDWEFGGFHKRKNGLTREAIILANTSFSDIARTVYDMLNGRIWVGHNIIEHDRVIVEQAFHKIGQVPPKPLDVFDTLDLCQRFIRGPVNRKMETVAEYFDLGKQTHRALDDVRLNLRLFVHCAAVFSLTESLSLLRAQDDNTNNNNNSFPRFPDPREFSIPTLRDESYDSFNKVREPISCASLNVRFGIDIKFWREDRSPKLSFMVDSPDNLSTKLDEFDWMLQGLFSSFRIDSEWRKVVDRKWNPPAVRLRITNTADEQTIVCKREDSGKTRRLIFKDYEGELQTLLKPGTRLDACLFVETYHYAGFADPTQEKGSAGIRLVAHKLIIHP
ncbi:hypothetical protein ACJRO7_006985 [Eucalyptus globulus]|uniref:Exonuclease domain-containing protein n=1 Tax=Eucalyptus globulus TaxID=34317 RepID=A0ABD3IMP7_EUCGL